MSRLSPGMVVKRLQNLLATDARYELLCTIPGVGLENGSLLLAEIGDIQRFGTDRQLLSFAGLDLVNYQSGNYEGKPRISKRGRPLIRRAAYQAVNISLISRRDNLFKRRYQQIIAKQGDSKDVRQKAKVKLSAKLVRIVFAVLSKKEPYQEALMDP